MTLTVLAGLAAALFFSCATTVKSREYFMATIQEDSKALQTDISYPVFEKYPDLSKAVEAAVVPPYNSFSRDVKESWAETNLQYKAMYGDDSLSAPQYSYIVKTEPIIVSGDFITLRIDTYIYSGGAHGNTAIETFTYNTKTGAFVTLNEATSMSLSQISTECRKALPLLIQKAGGSPSQQWISSGTEAKPENYRTFLYDGKTTTIIFGQYTVAPYSCGILQVTIPASE